MKKDILLFYGNMPFLLSLIHICYGLSPSPELSLTGSIGTDTYKEEIDAFLNTLPSMPDAFVCVSDYVACLLMQLLLKRGLKIPEDVAVSGFDGNMESPLAEDLTTCLLYTSQCSHKKHHLKKLLFQHFQSIQRHHADQYPAGIFYFRLINKKIFLFIVTIPLCKQRQQLLLFFRRSKKSGILMIHQLPPVINQKDIRCV